MGLIISRSQIRIQQKTKVLLIQGLYQLIFFQFLELIFLVFSLVFTKLSVIMAECQINDLKSKEQIFHSC